MDLDPRKLTVESSVDSAEHARPRALLLSHISSPNGGPADTHETEAPLGIGVYIISPPPIPSSLYSSDQPETSASASLSLGL